MAKIIHQTPKCKFFLTYFQPFSGLFLKYVFDLICVGYFPMQNLLKIAPSISSVVISPVISPR